MKTLRVALLYGGRSGEHEISVRSARSIHAVLRKTHSVFPIFIDKQGFWWRVDEHTESLPNTVKTARTCLFVSWYRSSGSEHIKSSTSD